MKYKTMIARSTVERVISRAWSSSAGKIVVIACTCISYGTSTFLDTKVEVPYDMQQRRENRCNRLHLHIVWDLNFRVKDAYCGLASRSRAGGVAQNEFGIDYHFMIGHRGLVGFGKQRFAAQMPDCSAR